MSRLSQRIAQDGLGFVIKYAWKRYFGEWDRVLMPSRVRDYSLEQNIRICIPVLSEADLPFMKAELEKLAAGSQGKTLEISIATYDFPLNEVPVHEGLSIRKFELSDGLEFLSFITAFRYVLLADNQAKGAKEQIEDVLQKLSLAPFRTAPDLLSSLYSRQVPQLKGKANVASPVVQQMKRRLIDGHYTFAEPIDWDIVSELPRKFEILQASADIRALPMSLLTNGVGRIARQFATGKIYGPAYFQGESVLDICCDLGGIRKSVGPNTKYVGIDMQGLGDYQLDLDKQALPFEPKTFDTVFCFEALEHLKDIHGMMDNMMALSKRHVVASLFIESALTAGKSINFFGDPLGNAHLPIAPVFDRHQWIFTFTDALDFIYYRARRSGFRVARLDLYYRDTIVDKERKITRAFAKGDLRYLAKHVMIVAFVLERVTPGATIAAEATVPGSPSTH